ncbi:MAG TPA: DUF1552 domain-containing protein [Polyangiaceae bacterium]
MARFRLNRRDVLRGAGSIAIGLPWLEAMEPVGTAHAAAPTVAQRFLAVYQPGGNVMDQWHPTGSETGFTLSPILAPLEAVRSKLLVLSGLDMKSAVGEQHQAGICALLTGMPQGTAGEFVTGPSVDQVIATIASQGKPRSSIEIAIRWATGKSHGLLHPINSMTFANDANASPVPPRLDPADIFNSLFGGLQPGDDGEATANVQRKLSILDFLDRRYASVAQRLGASDRLKLEEHLTRIREMEESLRTLGTPGGACAPPEFVETPDYDPTSGRNSADDGSIQDTSSDAAIPVVGKLMMDMLVSAMACDLTGVASLQWSDTEAKHTFPWLNLSEHHHYYQHDGNFRPVECQQIATWYSEQHAYLLQQMDAIDMGGHSLLDESVVFFGSEISHPPEHTKTDMPFLLAGGGGGLRGGRWLQYESQSHNDLLIAILNLFGDTRTTFGDPSYVNGPLSGLT